MAKLKKFVVFMFVVCLCVCCVAFAVACGEKTPETPNNPVTPQTVEVTGVTLDKTTLSVDAGGNATLVATVTPDNATNATVTWTTSNDKVATVAGGKVTGVAAGEATITATAGDKSATCTVTVNAVFDYTAGYPELEDKQTVTPGGRDEGDFEIPRGEGTDLTVGTAVSFEDFGKSQLLTWTVPDDLENTGFMLRTSYSDDVNDTDNVLRAFVYYVGITDENGTTWTYNQAPSMGGVMVGINISETTTEVQIVVEWTQGRYEGDELYEAKPVYFTLVVNDKAGH